MPWKESSAMSLRYEFVTFALCHSSNIRELCRRFEISSKTGYKSIYPRRYAGAERSFEASA